MAAASSGVSHRSGCTDPPGSWCGSWALSLGASCTSAARRAAAREGKAAVGVSSTLAGIHWTYIGSIERGERNVSVDNICKIGWALGAAVSGMFKETV
jgi:hypothetical protein